MTNFSKKTNGQFFQKKQMQFGEKRTDKHFAKQSKKSKIQRNRAMNSKDERTFAFCSTTRFRYDLGRKYLIKE